jgi:hypothetical protein
MPVYRFGDQEQPIFDQAHPDFRSDTEQRNTPLAVFDHDNPDIMYARRQVEEVINTSGAEVFVYIRTNNGDYDTVFDEDPDPTYWNKVPLKAYFKPAPLEAELKKWGAEIISKIEIVFSHMQLYKLFGERMLRAGDVIQIPYGAATTATNPKNYVVLNGTPSGTYKYVWLYFTCQTQTLSADITVRPPDDTPMSTDADHETYRESL